MESLYFRKWVFMAGAALFLGITGCGESDKITQVEKAVKDQEKKVEKNREAHSDLEGSVGSVKKELETLKERVAVLEKNQAETRVRLDELWTDDVDKSTFKKWKSGLTVPAVRVQRVDGQFLPHRPGRIAREQPRARQQRISRVRIPREALLFLVRQPVLGLAEQVVQPHA